MGHVKQSDVAAAKVGAPSYFEVASGEDRLAGAAEDRATMCDEWLSFIERNICAYKLSKAIPEDRDFRIDACSRSSNGFGIARFITIAGKAQLIRDGADIAKDGRDRYIVYMPVRGEVELSQFHREQTLGASSLVLLIAAEPFQHIKKGDNDTISFVLPREFVDQRIVDAENRCVRPIATQEGIGHLVRHTLAAFQRDASTMTDGEFQNAVSLIGDLLLLALSGCNDVMSGQPSIRATSLARAKRSIRARLDDPDLTLAEVAQTCRISLGYLHNLFRDDGRTVWQFLKAERLQRARQMLNGPGSRATTVTAISLACGFSNMSQFSTAFRRAFGVSPNDVLRGRQSSAHLAKGDMCCQRHR
jgi:AraC-like DNA-binding protein